MTVCVERFRSPKDTVTVTVQHVARECEWIGVKVMAREKVLITLTVPLVRVICLHGAHFNHEYGA